MSDKPNTLRTLQATSIFLASTAAGGNLGLSFFLIPRLLESPTPLMLRQWATSFHITKKIFPLMGTAAAITNFFLAYAFRRANVAAGGVVGGISTKSRLYLAAGVLCFGMVPYTVALLLPINTKLLRKVEETKDMGVTETEAREETARYLVDRWGFLNLARGLMLAAGGIVGLAASI